MSKQGNLNFGTSASEITEVGKYEFEPIQGFPMLNWRGKRPFTSTQFYPAQLKESYGEEVEGWRNRIYWGDNLQVMSHLLKDYRGKVKLIYIDPPYDSKADYKKIINIKGKQAINDYGSFEEKQYTDIWTNDEYLQYLYERLVIIRELLSNEGSIYVHLNHEKVHHVRCIMDELFGPSNFKNDIVWTRGPGKSHPEYFGRIKDTILFYTKTNTYTWNKQYGPISDEYRATFNKVDARGPYVTQPLHSGHPAKHVPIWQGVKPPEGRGWAYKLETLDKFLEEERIEWSAEGVPRLKRYLDEVEGAVIQDVWADIPAVMSRSGNYLKYPTQKPEALLERIISASTNPGDIVFDSFMGSGTTQAAAMKMGRRFLGADINLGAIQTSTKRLLSNANDLQTKQQTIIGKENYRLFTGLEVYNVNHYDIFRNPLEAKELLIEALEIHPFEKSNLYDGEKDGRMVKIMPVNRIATRADLNELISGFDYKAFERRQEEKPNQPVEKILLVCMGHEADLKAVLKKEVSFNLDVELVDILRDKANLEFKRESEARIAIEGKKLVVKQFYPMNLLQKLSLQKEKVDDWRELVESIMVDWNYDGAVLEPSVVDLPERDELVKGEYIIPKDAGTIRVKITDLLSESLEQEINHG
ncbi:site-specific DNA-methyltransferase [Desulfofustis limnaeus]|uniref:site-specific DNA-methyltransferase (adenine-specific) n=1 Tax=Desulfofustis limnaeus TaxID=2740163 RepID=A0ABN6M6G2_9BACT|nr:site-specific DNA-methyltransferase [Desulfofustis limnaeus]BDD88459.1 hypothetical protein DPPLL_28240 [Desulfofustis limnaeus]